MAHIKIPFKKEFRQALLDGKKTKTSRNKKYGDLGDTFDIFDGVFKITAIEKQPLEKVATQWYAEEGCDSPAAFRDIWIKLHPIKGFEAEKDVFVHTFTRIE